MRNKRGREDGECLVFSLYCGDRCSFVSEIGRHLGIIIFSFPLTPADWIGNVQLNRHGAANILILFVLHQYIVSTNILVLLTFQKFAEFLNFLNVSVFLPIGAAGPVPPTYWCYHVSWTDILVQLTWYWCKHMVKIDIIVCTLNIMVLQC